MRVAYTSDLHVDHSPENRRLTALLGERLRAERPEAFLLIGDVAARPRVVADTLGLIGEPPCPALFVAGNHDIWVSLREQRRGLNSFDRLDEQLPAVCADHGWHYLDHAPLLLDDVAFIGGMGWYDYSYRNRSRDAEITLEHFRAKSYGRWRWGDQHYARFPGEDGELLDDDALCGLLARRLEAQMRQAADWPARTVVAAFHHLPYAALSPPRRMPWDFFLGFAGAPRFGELLDSEERLAAVLFGHVHMKLSLFTPAGIPLRCSCVGYARDWPETELEQVLDRSLAFIEL
ncbi:MAG: hypothetical protein GF403_04620 [Candidatus Coatesbacteria bacterium]|nr:hypothetical protein [Candidatus Coatesbacteria bacterium]